LAPGRPAVDLPFEKKEKITVEKETGPTREEG